MARRRTRIAVGSALVLAACSVAAGASNAGPLELENTRPRPIEVRFEISPADQPGRLDSAWSAPRLALLESDPDPARVRIRIPAREMEEQLRSAGTTVIPGSFSDFVWTLDRATGQVVQAELAGRIREKLAMGPFTTRIAVEIRADMSTERRGGFRTTRGVLGIETHDFCSPLDEGERCVPVETRRYDPARGYVNAIGHIRAATPVAEVRAFSPLGEVRFSERTSTEVGRLADDAGARRGMLPDDGPG